MAGVRVDAVRQHRHAEEQRAENGSHPEHGLRRVVGFGAAKGGHAVGYRLDTREGDRARREALEDEEESERPAERSGSCERDALCREPGISARIFLCDGAT